MGYRTKSRFIPNKDLLIAIQNVFYEHGKYTKIKCVIWREMEDEFHGPDLEAKKHWMRSSRTRYRPWCYHNKCKIISIDLITNQVLVKIHNIVPIKGLQRRTEEHIFKYDPDFDKYIYHDDSNGTILAIDHIFGLRKFKQFQGQNTLLPTI